MESTSDGYRPLDRGRGLQRISFRPFGPQFGLQIREGGGGALLDPPLRTTAEHFVHLIITQTNHITLKSTNRCTLNLSLPFLSSKDRNAMNFDMNSS